MPLGEPPWSVASTTLFATEPYELVSSNEPDRYSPEDLQRGRLADLILHQNGAIVSSYGGGEVLLRCGGPAQGVLHFLDGDLREARTATAPRCLRRLLSEENGTFLGLAHHVNRPPEIFRFDPRGRVLQSAPIGGVWPEPGNIFYIPLQLLRARSPAGEERIVVSIAEVELTMITDLDRLRIASLDPMSLQTLTSTSLDRFEAHAVALSHDRSTFLASSDVDDRVAFLDPIELRNLRPPRALGLFSVISGPLRTPFNDDRVAVLIRDMDVPLMIVQQTQLRENVPISNLEGRGGGTDMVASDETHAALAGFESITHDSWVAPFNLEEERLEPGLLRLGYGPALALQVDALGRVWGRLPWEAKVFRLDPR